MNNKTLRKLLLSKGKPFQLFLALFGAFLGLLIFMGGVQVYNDVKALIVHKDMLGGDFIVVNKKVGLLHTISGNVPTFDDGEIAEIQKIEGLEKVGKFSAGTFKASLEMDGKVAEIAGPGLRSDLFLESVPNGYVDIAADEWQWKPADEEVPIIIPADYIKLYNAAFAQSQGLPVIPESIIKTISFSLKIKGQGKEWQTRGRIAGFSERINSILVPQSFLNYANQNYGTKEKTKPSRLILHSKDPTAPKLASALRDRGLELNEEKLKSSEINGILQILISVVSAVGVLIVILAFLGFMQYNQLMAYRSAYEIQTLHWLGYKVTSLSRPYIRFTFLSVFTTFFLSTLSVVFFQYYFCSWLDSKGFSMALPGVGLAIVAGFVISLLMAGLSSMVAHRQVKSLAQ